MAPRVRLKNVSSIGRKLKPGGVHRRLPGFLAVAALTAACTALPPSAEPPASPGTQVWASGYHTRYGSPRPSAIAVTPDGRAVFVTGAGPTTVSYDAATGMQRWARGYNGPAKSVNIPAAIAVSPDGRRVFVTGWDRVGDGADYATIAYSASTGRQLWLSRYSPPAGGTAVASAVVVSRDGKTVFVTGHSGGSYTTIAYNTATGARRWLKRLGVATTDSKPRDMALSPDGKTIYVTGDGGGALHHDYLTVAYNAATGATRWFTNYNGPANGNDDANALVVAPDGKTVYVTGGSAGRSSGSDYATVAYDAATGAQRWVSRYNGPGNADDEGGSLAITPDGRTLLVNGLSKGPNHGPGRVLGDATVAYNAATGAWLWTQRTLGYPGDYSSLPALKAQTLAISPDGSTAYVTGINAVTCCKSDYATVAYAIDGGTTQWLSLYSGPGKYKGSGNNSNQAIALALSPGGSTLYVTGVTVRTKFGGFGTVAYRT